MFNSLKESLTSAPILSLPKFDREFRLAADKSNTGIGAVLSQLNDDGREHVIAYASRSLTKAENNILRQNEKP